jgi:hypothetical protein
MSDIPGFREFEFDLPSALLDQLVTVLDGMDAAPLTVATAASIPEAQGVYQLLYRGELAYIGKTDAQAGLRLRIDRHARKIVHRQGITTADLTFKAVQILVFSAMDLETALIAHYATRHQPTPWNNSGFGANDPGRNRDHSRLKDGHFDLLYPIDIDHPIDSIPEDGTAAELLTALRSAVPYVIRWQGGGGRKPHADLEAARVTLAPGPKTARDVVTAVVAQLPPGWQATQLPGYVILYKESTTYVHGTVIARS